MAVVLYKYTYLLNLNLTALEFALSRIGLGEDTAALEDIVESCHLQFLIFMHYSCIYAGKKYVYFDHDGFVSLLDSR